MQEEKEKIRESIWRKMERYELATYPRPCYGSIPNFVGARSATLKITRLPEYRRADTIFVDLSASMKFLREFAIKHGKTLVLPAPDIRRGFIILDGAEVRNRSQLASTIKGAVMLGKKVRILKDISVDIYAVGSVAVDLNGGRLGRGRGYDDLVYAILRELRVTREDTPILTIVHDIQIIDSVPMDVHDFPVDYIATPSRFIRTNTSIKKPNGIFWESLSVDTIREIPILRILAGI